MIASVNITSRNNLQLDLKKNIDAVERAIQRKPLSQDDVLLIDTKWILVGLLKNLEDRGIR